MDSYQYIIWIFNYVVLLYQTANQKHISTTTLFMATKFCKVVKYHEEFPPVSDVMWKIKYFGI